MKDGAEPLHKHARVKLPDFTLVLDSIHVDEYLWKAGTVLYGDTDVQRATWVEIQIQDVFSSHTERVIQRLEKEASACRKKFGWKSTLSGRPLFAAQFRIDGLCQLSRTGLAHWQWMVGGTGCHLVKDRMELSGMRGTISVAGAFSALHAVNENGDWEEFHGYRRKQLHKELCGTSMNMRWLRHLEKLEIN